jgi:hypothetical protein
LVLGEIMIDKNKVIYQRMRAKGGFLPFIGTRPFTRNDMAELFCEFGYKIGAEIGVRRGNYSLTLCEKIAGLKLYCVDPWISDPDIKSQDTQNKNKKVTFSRLKNYDVEYLEKTSEEALKDIPDSSLDFVYIDALHDFDNAMFDIIGWNRKVKIGGILSGHDFYRWPRFKIIPAVEAFAKAHNVQPWFVTNETKVILPSWFWVKS